MLTWENLLVNDFKTGFSTLSVPYRFDVCFYWKSPECRMNTLNVVSALSCTSLFFCHSLFCLIVYLEKVRTWLGMMCYESRLVDCLIVGMKCKRLLLLDRIYAEADQFWHDYQLGRAVLVGSVCFWLFWVAVTHGIP